METRKKYKSELVCSLCITLGTGREGYPSKRVTLRLALTYSLFFFLHHVYKAARVTCTWVSRLPYLRAAARVTLAGGLTFSLINTPGKVNCLIVSRPLEWGHPKNADHADCRLQTADRAGHADCADRADCAD